MIEWELQSVYVVIKSSVYYSILTFSLKWESDEVWQLKFFRVEER